MHVESGSTSATARPALRANARLATIDSVTLNWTTNNSANATSNVYDMIIQERQRIGNRWHWVSVTTTIISLNLQTLFSLRNTGDSIKHFEFDSNGQVQREFVITAGTQTNGRPNITIAGLNANTNHRFVITAKNSAGDTLASRPIVNVTARTASWVAPRMLVPRASLGTLGQNFVTLGMNEASRQTGNSLWLVRNALTQNLDGFTIQVIQGRGSSAVTLGTITASLDSNRIIVPGTLEFTPLSEGGRMLTVTGTNLSNIRIEGLQSNLRHTFDFRFTAGNNVSAVARVNAVTLR